MTDPASPTILIAEDNDISRELMAGVLAAEGYNIAHAIDGDEAIRALRLHKIDLALVDLNMSPKGGFEFAKHILVNGIQLPIIIITAEDASDILLEAGNLGISRVMQKPVEPARLKDTVARVLKRQGSKVAQPIAVDIRTVQHNSEQIMERAIELAERNIRDKKGGPFGAVVADEQGRILGEGTNGITSRVDPTAHAEIMAIRKAAEKLGRSDLSDCVLYCSSEPTMMGHALIVSVGIKKVYYGLTHQEIKALRARENDVRSEIVKTPQTSTQFIQISHDHARTVLDQWEALPEKLQD